MIHDDVPDQVDATITISAEDVRALAGDIGAVDDVVQRASDVSDEAAVRRFFGAFDPLPAQPPKLVVR